MSLLRGKPIQIPEAVVCPHCHHYNDIKYPKLLEVKRYTIRCWNCDGQFKLER